MIAGAASLEDRARQTLGSSGEAIHAAVEAALAARGAGGTLADIGCGSGRLWRRLAPRFSRCTGVDAVRFEGLPGDIDFRAADLDGPRLPLDDDLFDVVTAVETIEHLENPRALFRELTRITRPGGLVLVTTPNQLSLLSLLTLVTKQQFSAFQDNSYPAHRTALLEVDLRRIASECGLRNIETGYTCSGRMPLTALHYPAALSRACPRLCSDNAVLCAVKPA
ncbi:MAG TPA: methyltransferase domain-containing protein [Vicinamibacterales bacterium]|nr:methyltransferase domain-containing protein [Vicinamibacterales bacterium]